MTRLQPPAPLPPIGARRDLTTDPLAVLAPMLIGTCIAIGLLVVAILGLAPIDTGADGDIGPIVRAGRQMEAGQ